MGRKAGNRKDEGGGEGHSTMVKGAESSGVARGKGVGLGNCC